MALDIVYALRGCYSEYGEFLEELGLWLDELDFTTKTFSDAYDFHDLISSLRAQKSWLTGLLKLYSNNTIGKAQVAAEILMLDNSDFKQTIERAYADIQQLIVAPMQNYITERESMINNTYYTALEMFERLHGYIDTIEFRSDARDMGIWLKPLPNIESPQAS